MSIKDMIKKSVLGNFNTEAMSQYDLPRLVLALLVALALGCLIYLAYRHFYVGVVFSRSFALTLVGMTVTYLYGNTGHQYQHSYLVRYGRCIVHCPFSYSG